MQCSGYILRNTTVATVTVLLIPCRQVSHFNAIHPIPIPRLTLRAHRDTRNSHNALNTLCTPTLPASSLLSTYGLISPFSHIPPMTPPFPRNLSLNASGPTTNKLPISASTSRLGSKLAPKSQVRKSSVYLVRSLVTMMPPAALTWNFLKWSRSRPRKPVASSVRKAVKLGEGPRAVRAWL